MPAFAYDGRATSDTLSGQLLAPEHGRTIPMPARARDGTGIHAPVSAFAEYQTLVGQEHGMEADVLALMRQGCFANRQYQRERIPSMHFRADVIQSGKTSTGIQVPDEVVAELNAGKRPPVRVTINGHTYRTTVAPMGGQYWIPLSAENREGAGIAAGDAVDIDIEHDTEPREVTVPPELVMALDHEPAARAFFDGLSYSNRRRHVLAIDGAKSAETRQRRIDKAVALFRQGKS